MLAFQLVWSGELERARPLLEESARSSERAGRPRGGGALWLLSLLEWRAGNWELGARHAADSLALRAQFGREGGQPMAELPAAVIAAHQGRIEDARDRSERALALAEADGLRIGAVGPSLGARLHRALARRCSAALGYLERAWEIRDSVRVLEPGHRLDLADTLEALIAVGELGGGRAEARTVGEARASARPLVGAGDHGPLPRAPARRARRSRGRLGGLRARAGRARADSGSVPARAYTARARRDAAASEAARRRPPDARAGARRLRAARRPALGREGASELARIAGRAPSRGELTEAERRIAALVAEGRTNREVAAALFVTEHTVEGALTRAYRKLGVRSRTELAHRLGHET